MRRKKSLLLLIAAISVVLLFLSGCGRSFICESCGQSRSGKAYYGMNGDEVMCEDCARSYWMPLDYREFEWNSIPPQDSSINEAIDLAASAPVDAYAEDPVEQAEQDLRAQIAEVSKQLDSYDASGDVKGALGYLIQQLDQMEITYNQKDSALLARLESYRASYQQQALQEAMDEFEKSGYENAAKVLYEAQALLGTEDEEISQAIAYYEAFGPAWLDSLDYFAREPGMFGSAYWNAAYETLRTDSEGNEHTHAMYIEVSTRAATQTYVIDGKYAQFTGTVYLPKESQEMDENSYFRVYGDGILLYTSPAMREGVRAVPFSVDISGVTQLMIAADSDDHPYNNTLCIGEAFLAP